VTWLQSPAPQKAAPIAARKDGLAEIDTPDPLTQVVQALILFATHTGEPRQ